MGFSDILMMILIAGGAVWLLYRSIFRKKGNCHGSGGDGCSGSCGCH